MAESEEDNGKVYLCRYQVKSFIVMMGEEKVVMEPNNILSFEYLNDYEFHIMALLKVSLKMDIRKRIWMLKNKREIIAKFELDKIGMNTEEEVEPIIAPEEAWNLEFGIYFNDDEEATDVSEMEARLEKNEGEEFTSNNIDNENFFESESTIDLYLFHPQLLKASRFSFNRIYTENTLQNMVGEMLTASGHCEVLMSTFDNDEIYKEILVPPNPLYKCLVYLDQYFGFYKKGAMIYYDIDTLYILNPNGELTAKREEEWTECTFLVAALDSANPGNGMRRKEGEKIYYPLLSEMDVNPQMASIGENAQKGSEAKIVYIDDHEVEFELFEADQSIIDDRNERVIQVKKNNKYTGEIIKARMEENECLVFISGNNLDVNAFRPNRIYKIIFEEESKNKKYGSFTYRLAYAYHAFKAESENYMISSHRIGLKKVIGEPVKGDDWDGDDWEEP